MIACCEGHTDIVKVLLQCDLGVDVNLQYEDGDTALTIAECATWRSVCLFFGVCIKGATHGRHGIQVQIAEIDRRILESH